MKFSILLWLLVIELIVSECTVCHYTPVFINETSTQYTVHSTAAAEVVAPVHQPDYCENRVRKISA